jgi:predicted MFS family arabinose efflux permease
MSLRGIQFTHILDFMIMIPPLGPEFIQKFNINTHEFSLLLSSYTFAAAIAGVFATYLAEQFSEIYSYG